MSPAALVIVLVGSGEAGSDWAAGTLQALREALDRRVVIELREAPELPSPDDAYVVSVSFSRDGRRASLRCVAPTGRPGKELEFRRGDRPLDRGRAVGYALGALLPELRADAPAPPPSAAAPPASPPPSPVAEAETTPPPRPPPPEQQPQAAAAPVVEAAPQPQAQRPQGRLGFEVTAFVSSSFVSSNPGFGGALAVELRTLDWLGVRIGGGGAFGNSPLPASTVREVILRGGLRAAMFQSSGVAVSAVAHALLVQLEMYLNGTEQETWRGGAELSLELAFLPASMLSVVLKPTARTTFGAIQIYVNQQRVAAITPFVFCLELGLRIWP